MNTHYPIEALSKIYFRVNIYNCLNCDYNCDGRISTSSVFPQFKFTSFHVLFMSREKMNSINWSASNLWVFIQPPSRGDFRDGIQSKIAKFENFLSQEKDAPNRDCFHICLTKKRATRRLSTIRGSAADQGSFVGNSSEIFIL